MNIFFEFLNNDIFRDGSLNAIIHIAPQEKHCMLLDTGILQAMDITIPILICTVLKQTVSIKCPLL